MDIIELLKVILKGQTWLKRPNQDHRLFKWLVKSRSLFIELNMGTMIKNFYQKDVDRLGSKTLGGAQFKTRL